jgi:hypothetical protein
VVRFEVDVIVTFLPSVLKECHGIVSACWRWTIGDATCAESKAGAEKGSGGSQEVGAFSRRGVSGWPPYTVFVAAWAHIARHARAAAVSAPGNVHVQGLDVVKGRRSGC